MALEPAGVDLQAKGFKQYIGQLAAIERAQKEAFDNSELKNLGLSYNRVISESKKFEAQNRRLANVAKLLNINLAGININLAGIATGGALAVLNIFTEIARVGARAFINVSKQGVILNQEIETTAKVFGNVFDNPQLGEATVAAIQEIADEFRIGRSAALGFGQSILPRTSSLETFGELLRLTDIQADTTGQTVNDLEFSIREALTGDFVSLRDRFDLSREAVDKIKELTPALGADVALALVLGEEFERLGKVNLSGTLGTDIKDIQARFVDLNTVLGRPIFEEVSDEAQQLIILLEENDEELRRVADAIGDVVANIIDFTGTEFAEFVEQLDFGAIEQGIDNVFRLIEGFRVLFDSVQAIAETGAFDVIIGTFQQDALQVAKGLAQLANTNPEQVFEQIGQAVEDSKQRIEAHNQSIEERGQATQGASDADRDAINSLLAQNNALSASTEELEAYKNAIRQAEQLELSFARAAEDAARRLSRQQAKLGRDQLKDRLELLDDQAKEFDEFQQDELESVQEAQEELSDAQQKAAKEQIQDQDKLFRELRQARDRFNLDTIQSQRRFQLQDRRLRASGDILALQELREDFALQQLENKENFDLQQGQRKDDAKSQEQIANEQRQEQIKQLEQQVSDLQGGLDQRRTEFLAAQEEELNALLVAQQEQRQSLQESYLEQQEDARINQQRQIEDLGRALATQEGITAEGVMAIAGEIEGVFGQEGVADTIFAGFTARTESEFQTLFDSVEEIINKSGEELKKVQEEIHLPVVFRGSSGGSTSSILGGLGASSGAPPDFNDGGIVPGARGSPQLIQAHGGETVLPTHRMSAPLIPSQTLNVNMSGGFDINGGEAAGEAVVRAAVTEMTDMVEIAVKRLTRRI